MIIEDTMIHERRPVTADVAKLFRLVAAGSCPMLVNFMHQLVDAKYQTKPELTAFLNSPNGHGDTVLQLACRSDDNLQMVQFLLQQKVDPKLKNISDQQAVQISLANNAPKCTLLLLLEYNPILDQDKFVKSIGAGFKKAMIDHLLEYTDGDPQYRVNTGLNILKQALDLDFNNVQETLIKKVIKHETGFGILRGRSDTGNTNAWDRIKDEIDTRELEKEAYEKDLKSTFGNGPKLQ